jgi:serine/threonine protein kinase
MTETESPPSLSLVSHIDALPPGSRLAEFEIVDLLGVGGFGMVYKAFDHSLQRLVAIKEYMPSALAGRSRGLTVSMKSTADALTFMAGLKSFVAEARLLAQFDHPSLVKVFRFWEANNTAYMVMPLYSGMTFKQARNHMRCPPPEAWLRKVLWSVLGALNVLHDGNTMHRDVSPDNIFLQDSGPPVLLDLGAARRAISDKSQKHTAILKVNYAPIEQYADADDMRQGPWTDLYSLAAVVHGCLCNEPPVPATFRVLKDRLPTFASVAETVSQQFGQQYSESFIAAITHALAIRPEQRQQNTDEFAHEMALETPPGMSRFDWRAELGELYLPSGVQAEEVRALLTTTPDAATELFTAGGTATRREVTILPEIELPGEEDYRASPLTLGVTATPRLQPMPQAAATPLTASSLVERAVQPAPVAAHPAATPMQAPKPAPVQPQPARTAGDAHVSTQPAALFPAEPDRKRGIGVPLAIAAGVLLLAGAGVWALLGRGAPADGSLAAPLPAASAPTQVAQPEPPVPPVDPKTEEIIPSTPAHPTASAAVAAAATRPASGAASASLAAASAPPKRLPAQMAVAPSPSASAQRVVIQEVRTPVVTVEPPPPVPARPAPRPPTRTEGQETAAAPRQGPVERCADSSFLGRPMCLYRECQKPEFASLAMCVEQKQRYQQNNPNSP